jgi:phosphinothricin acetyltransferase
VGLHRACGFTPVGTSHKIGFKFGKWHDVAWWECVLSEHTIPPRPRKTLSDVIGTPAWSDALLAGVPIMRSR